MNLQSKFGYCIITQTLNITLCLLAGRNYGQTDGRTDGQTDRQTNGWTDDPITRCPRRTFQAGGIKTSCFQSAPKQSIVTSLPVPQNSTSSYTVHVHSTTCILDIQHVNTIKYHYNNFNNNFTARGSQ